MVFRSLDLTDEHQEKREKPFTKAASYSAFKPLFGKE